MDNLRRDIRAAFSRQQAALGNVAETKEQLLRRALTPRGSFGLRSVAGATATVVVAAAIAVAVLLSHGHIRQDQPSPQNPQTVEEALTAGPAAAVPTTSDRQFVWLTGYIIHPQSSGSQDGQVAGTTVAVLDWTGKVRYHFDLPKSTGRPNDIQSISADGTRALLADGTVVNEMGAVVARLTSLATQGMPQNSTHWMPDDQHICVAFSNEPVASYPPTHPKGAPGATPTPAQPYTLPDADHSVTLKVYALDGGVRSVATIGAGSLGIPSGPFGDSASVLSCNSASDLAVVARYHDAGSPSSQTSTNMTVSLWAIRLSTGSVLYHQPETRMALGRAFFFGSQNGKLAVEFLWNSQVAGAERDVVLQIPSGEQVPVTDAEPIPDTPGLSADGTRILRRIVDQADNRTYLELINAANGRIVRRVTLPGIVGATAVALPNSSSFIVQVANYLAFVDGNGGVTLLHPDANLGGSNAPGMVGLPPVALQN
jgi:hypothetical protein